MPRLPFVNEDASPEVAEVYAEIAGSRGRVLNVFRALGHAPEGLRRLAAVGEYNRFGASLTPRVRELVTLATARANDCQYEWTQHAPLALRTGIEQEQIDSLNAGNVPEALTMDETAAVQYAFELARRRGVSDEVWNATEKHYNDRQMTDLTLLIAYYTALGFTLNAFRVELQPGQEPLLRDAPAATEAD